MFSSQGRRRSVARSGRTCMSLRLTSSRSPVPSGITPVWSIVKTDTQKLSPLSSAVSSSSSSGITFARAVPWKSE